MTILGRVSCPCSERLFLNSLCSSIGKRQSRIARWQDSAGLVLEQDHEKQKTQGFLAARDFIFRHPRTNCFCRFMG